MRTGTLNVEKRNLSDDVKLDIATGVSLFLKEALKAANIYKTHCNRKMTAKDIILSLKYEVFNFDSIPEIDRQLLNLKEELKAVNLDESESSEDSDSDTEIVDFTSNECGCTVCKQINSISAKWEQWDPSTPLEMALYTAINKCENQVST